MYCKRLCCVVVATLALTVVSGAIDRPVLAEEPETISITFALTVPFDAWAPDFDASVELSDYVGEDTVVILTGDLVQTGVGSMDFGIGSLPCDGVEVEDTQWWTLGKGTVVNKGGPIYATVWTIGGPTPPPHSALVAKKITEVHACWVTTDGVGTAWVQEDWRMNTELVFIIVTGEFRVKD